jgi:AraC-like DNA-binding protein
MTPGTAIWIRPGQVQRWGDVHNDFDADVVVFASSRIPDLPLFDHIRGAATVTQLGRDSDRMRQQMGWIAEDLEANRDEATAAAVVGVILRIFARNAKGSGGSSDSPGQKLVASFLDSVDRHIGQRSVTWHAQQIGASTRTVARATVETLDRRPKEVIDARVILEAQRRLAWSQEDVATIARALRFTEASNFTKFFRSRTGTSPSAFRTAVTGLSTVDLSTENAD